MNNEKAKFLQIQKGQCPRCGLYFRDGDLLKAAVSELLVNPQEAQQVRRRITPWGLQNG